MTIVAGFRCNDGIVLCADTQEETGYLKHNVPKLVVKENLGRSYGYRAIFAGAGGSDLVDYLIEKLWESIEAVDAKDKRSGSMASKRKWSSAVIQAIEQELIDQHRSLAPIYPSGMPEAKFLIALWTPHGSDLVSTSGPLLKRDVWLHSIGAGWVIANYIADRLVRQKTRMIDAVPIAIYMIDQAKKHVEGCGGETNVVTLADDGSIRSYDQREVQQLSKDFDQMDDLVRQIVRFVMDGALEEKEYKKLVDNCLADLEKLRKGSKQ